MGYYVLIHGPSLFGSTLVLSSLQVFVAANSNAVLRLVNVQNGMVLQKLKVGVKGSTKGENQPKVQGGWRKCGDEMDFCKAIFVRIFGSTLDGEGYFCL